MCAEYVKSVVFCIKSLSLQCGGGGGVVVVVVVVVVVFIPLIHSFDSLTISDSGKRKRNVS